MTTEAITVNFNIAVFMDTIHFENLPLGQPVNAFSRVAALVKYHPDQIANGRVLLLLGGSGSHQPFHSQLCAGIEIEGVIGRAFSLCGSDNRFAVIQTGESGFAIGCNDDFLCGVRDKF